jgi:hypothetical protein
MKIAILGSRGIPNHYGGFEQLAEYLSQGLTKFGHEVFVYNSHNHPNKKNKYKDVHIIHKYDPDYLIGSASQFIYDLLCILDTRDKSFDIILKLGYGTNFMWDWLIPKKSAVICNIDGLEWKRDRYNKLIQFFLKIGESYTVKNTKHLITDSIYMHAYLKERYKITSYHISYGAFIFAKPDPSVLKKYQLTINNYNMLIARLVPDNNIDMILQGVLKSPIDLKFIVIGDYKTRYGNYLTRKYKQQRIQFLGGIYNQTLLNNLRYYSNLYFHGHSAGGTNPSLLEAMACSSLICAYDTVFNRAILGGEAYYFSSVEEVKLCLQHKKIENRSREMLELNIKKISADHSWISIVSQYNDIFHKITKLKKVYYIDKR